jgi:hypothetical protein
MNNWQEDLLKNEKAEFDKNQANKRSIELHTKFLLQLSKEHYLIRKSINSTAKPKLISRTELLEILLADERTKSLFKIIPPTHERQWKSNIICKQIIGAEYLYEPLYENFKTEFNKCRPIRKFIERHFYFIAALFFALFFMVIEYFEK